MGYYIMKIMYMFTILNFELKFETIKTLQPATSVREHINAPWPGWLWR